MSEPTLYIGLMSGTSLDAIDAALIEIHDGHIQVRETHSSPIEDALHRELLALCQPGDNEIDRMGSADRMLGRLFARSVEQLLDKSGLDAASIRAIGSHGQTIRHRPQGPNGFSLQIGDPNTIRHLTGITTVSDFRRMDIAAGGQGAPLVPAFHRAAFYCDSRQRSIVNIGGMANITLLYPDRTEGFDCGPGNVLMDHWIAQHRGQRYDSDGQWAASGKVLKPLLAALLGDAYFSTPAPKSTGRERFNAHWLEQKLPSAYHPQDVQATLLELTAQSIAEAVRSHSGEDSAVYLCGGGAHNGALQQRLAELLAPRTLDCTDQLGIAADWVEAAAFAWLAHQALCAQTGNCPQVTGACQEEILGAVYPSSALLKPSSH